MNITPATKLTDLLKEYPELLGFLSNYRAEFKKLRNPLLRKTVARFATLETVAQMGGVEVDRLIQDIKGFLGERTYQQSEDRSDAIKDILRKLHRGVPLEELKEEFRVRLGDLDPTELARAEERLVLEEGIAPEEIQNLCDLHVAVFQDALKGSGGTSNDPHPLRSLMDENKEILKMANELSEATKDSELRDDLLQRLEKFWELVNGHYLKKENLLFPFLERRGVTAPPQVMWGVHDEIRQGMQQLITAARKREGSVLSHLGPEVMRQVADMVFKEETILAPMSLHTLTPKDWEEMAKAQDESTWQVYRGGESDLIGLRVGFLAPDQIDLIFRHLPLDITFVDENDTVRFYSGVADRIFPRAPSVIGRKVQNCHPPKSLHLVEQILAEFKAGRRDVAEFWIRYRGRFVHIRYFALRDDQGHYRGTLEVTQDVTDIRTLEGEKRLLDWK